MNNLVSVSSCTKDCSCTSLCSNNKVYQSILDTVGNTPLVKLNKLPKNHGVACDIYVKCEFFNPAGSTKDRIACAMFKDAQAVKAIKKDTKLVEPTSGNTGIGIAFNAACLGNKCTIVMAEKNSAEKVDTMQLMGAEVIKVKTGITQIARQIKDKNPDKVVMLNQYCNYVNPKIHYDTTGAEIVSAMDRVDVLVAGVGTGGTISGVGARLKHEYPGCLVVAGEPEGSVMINEQGKQHPFLVEGIGGYEPEALMVLDKSILDHFEVVTDQEAFLMAREMARTEGILCGGSSGLAMVAAIKAANTLKIGAGKSMVVILPDGIRNYMSKFVSDQWMEARLFMDPPQRTMKWWKAPITELNVSHVFPKLNQAYTCEQALNAMMEYNANIAVIVDDQERFVGAFTKDSLRNFATNPLNLLNVTTEEIDFEDPVTKYLAKDCYTLAENGKKGMPTIGLLSLILDITPFVIIGQDIQEKDSTYLIPKGVVTGDDVLDYIFDQSNIMNQQC